MDRGGCVVRYTWPIVKFPQARYAPGQPVVNARQGDSSRRRKAGSQARPRVTEVPSSCDEHYTEKIHIFLGLTIHIRLSLFPENRGRSLVSFVEVATQLGAKWTTFTTFFFFFLETQENRVTGIDRWICTIFWITNITQLNCTWYTYFTANGKKS